jgi:hypothetical protein
MLLLLLDSGSRDQKRSIVRLDWKRFLERSIVLVSRSDPNPFRQRYPQCFPRLFLVEAEIICCWPLLFGKVRFSWNEEACASSTQRLHFQPLPRIHSLSTAVRSSQSIRSCFFLASGSLAFLRPFTSYCLQCDDSSNWQMLGIH